MITTETKKKDITGWTQVEKFWPVVDSITGRRAYLCALTFHSLVRLVDPHDHSFIRSLACSLIN